MCNILITLTWKFNSTIKMGNCKPCLRRSPFPTDQRFFFVLVLLFPCIYFSGDPNAKCLQHGFMLHMKYQVVYPFPTFQPAFQLKKDQVVLLNTSYSLVACAVSVHTSGKWVWKCVYVYLHMCVYVYVNFINIPFSCNKNSSSLINIPY